MLLSTARNATYREKDMCKLVKMERVGLQAWKATVKCADGSTQTATSANKNQSKQLACQKCKENN